MSKLRFIRFNDTFTRIPDGVGTGDGSTQEDVMGTVDPEIVADYRAAYHTAHKKETVLTDAVIWAIMYQSSQAAITENKPELDDDTPEHVAWVVAAMVAAENDLETLEEKPELSAYDFAQVQGAKSLAQLVDMTFESVIEQSIIHDEEAKRSPIAVYDEVKRLFPKEVIAEKFPVPGSERKAGSNTFTDVYPVQRGKRKGKGSWYDDFADATPFGQTLQQSIDRMEKTTNKESVWSSRAALDGLKSRQRKNRSLIKKGFGLWFQFAAFAEHDDRIDAYIVARREGDKDVPVNTPNPIVLVEMVKHPEKGTPTPGRTSKAVSISTFLNYNLDRAVAYMDTEKKDIFVSLDATSGEPAATEEPETPVAEKIENIDRLHDICNMVSNYILQQTAILNSLLTPNKHGVITDKAEELLLAVNGMFNVVDVLLKGRDRLIEQVELKHRIDHEHAVEAAKIDAAHDKVEARDNGAPTPTPTVQPKPAAPSVKVRQGQTAVKRTAGGKK
jgi:hypothetical protein